MRAVNVTCVQIICVKITGASVKKKKELYNVSREKVRKIMTTYAPDAEKLHQLTQGDLMDKCNMNQG